MPNLTYQYRIYPFGEQVKTLERWLELCRRLYNAALEQRRWAYQEGRRIGYLQQAKELTQLRASMSEYKDVPVHILQNVLLRLDRAFENFFRRCCERKAGKKVKVGYPRFKRYYRSLTSPDSYDYIQDGKLIFPKLGLIRIEMHRPLPEGAKIKTCTIVKKADGWYASLCLDVPDVPKPVNNGGAVGIDMGLDSFVALSTGEMVSTPKFLRMSERRLKKAQRALSRRIKGSNRYRKQREKVALLHLKVSRQRDDFQWKLATDLARRFSFIAVEELNIRNMVRNHFLAKSISDAAWSAFVRTRLAHSVVKTGARLVFVNARNTSRMCSSCGWIRESMTLADRVFRCERCGLVLNRDVNAARNVLIVGRDTPEVTLGEIGPLPKGKAGRRTENRTWQDARESPAFVQEGVSHARRGVRLIKLLQLPIQWRGTCIRIES